MADREASASTSRRCGEPAPALTAPALKVEGLHKTYAGGFTAVDGLDIEIPDGALRWWEINAAVVGGGMVRGAIVGAGVLAVSFPLTRNGSAEYPLVLAAGTTGLLVAAAQLGVIAGSLAKSQDHVYSMESIVLLPLGFLGGVFYSVTRLPSAWRVLSYLDPVFWVVQVERIGFLGRGDVSALLAVTVVWVLAAAMSVWSAVIFANGRLKP